MPAESKVVVYAALGGNLGVAVAKFGAAALSGSSAMLTEAVHSAADTLNQVMLLLGNRRSERPADDGHPFGYGGEIYFWAFVVAVMVLIAGGVVSIVQGVHQLRDPKPIGTLPLNLAVLAVSAVFEGGSLIVGYRAAQQMVRRHPGDGRPVSLWTYIKVSKDPNMYEPLLEDSVALIGITIAAAGIVGSSIFGLLWMDGAASIAIGLLLVGASYVIAYATRSLVAGESAAPALRQEIREALQRDGLGDAYAEVRTLHLGPDTILAAVTLRSEVAAHAFPETSERFRRCLRDVDERFRHVVFDTAEPAWLDAFASSAAILRRLPR